MDLIKQIILALCIGGNVLSIPQFYGTDSFYQPGQHANFKFGSNGHENTGRPRNQWAARNAGRPHINVNGFESNFFKRESKWSTKTFDPFDPNNPGYSSNSNSPVTRTDQTRPYRPTYPTTRTNSFNPTRQAGQTRTYNPPNSGKPNDHRNRYGQTKSGVRYELDPYDPVYPVDRSSKKSKQNIPEGKYVHGGDQIYDDKCYQTAVVHEYRIACHNYQNDFSSLIPFGRIRGSGKSERAIQECNMLKEAGVDIECKITQN